MRDPYRPPPAPVDPELARLAQVGERNRLAVQRAASTYTQESGGSHLRVAIGAYRGSVVRQALLAGVVLFLLLGGLGTLLTPLGYEALAGAFAGSFALAFACFMFWVFVAPRASPAAVDAERAWSMSLPFAFSGYFELLAGEPMPSRQVTYDIVWRTDGTPPDPNLLHQIFGAVDPHARLLHADRAAARIVGGPISGVTGIRINRVRIYRNHRIVANLHGVVDRVLVPLHRSHPIASITVSG